MRWMAWMAVCLVAPLWAWAGQGATTLEETVVVGEKLLTPTRQAEEQVYTGTEITREGLGLAGPRASTSVYEAMDILPGVQVESADPVGLAAEQRSIRVRGVRGFLGSLTVEGVPNWGGNPMGPREYLYDLDNIAGLAVYKGAIPAGLGTGVGARGGAMELRPRWPGQDPGLDMTLAVGGNAYQRAFGRVDTGSLGPAGTAASIAASITEADKWKGPGSLGPRTNWNMMLEQPYHGDDAIRMWFNYTDLDQYLYRTMPYAEVDELHRNYRKDFLDTKTGIKSKDIEYYKNNRASHTNWEVLGIVPFSFTDMVKLTLKPYAAAEDARIFQGVTSQNGTVQQRLRDIERHGLLSQVDVTMPWARLAVGHLWETVDMAITTKNYHPTTGAFLGYGILTENDGNGYVNSPFATLSGTVGAIDWQVGVKYFRYDEPASTGFVTSGGVLKEAPDLARDAKTYDIWLPSAGISYSINDMIQPYASYGKSHIRPYSYVPIINLYNQNRSTFQDKGITLEDLFDGYKMEESDNFELGVRINATQCSIMPAVFYGKHKHLLTTVYDPRVKLNYQQNVGEATSYGVEVEANFYLTDDLTVFINPTYLRMTYDDDLTFAGSTLDVEGNQVVDVPQWMVKAGMVWKYGKWKVIPMLRYMGDRYGDAQHNERIDGFTVVDLGIHYVEDQVPFARSMRLSLNISNLLDTEYVSLINASDDTRTGGASYLVGAPLTAVLSLGLTF